MIILWGLVGIITIFFVAFLLSENKKSINLRTVGGAFIIQAAFALLVLYVPAGQKTLLHMSTAIQNAISAGNKGLDFVFGPLSSGNIGFIFAVKVLSIIIFFASLISVLYHLKIMPLIINTLGYAIHKMLKTSRAESLSATANIFVGQTEAPLVIKPFLSHMTRSEIFAVMVGGLASVAGAVLVGYASLGIDIGYLVAASFMSAPGGLLMAKIMVPETAIYKDKLDDLNEEDRNFDYKATNVIEAAANGASAGLKLSLTIGAMLIAFIGLVSLLDIILGAVGGIFGYDYLSFRLILGYGFSPFAFIMGVPWDEAMKVGVYLGEKIVFNEFVAFLSLSENLATMSPKAQIIATFSLCGFANISSIGILLGGIGVMAKNQKSVIASLAVKAVIAGTLSNFMSATLAGIILSL